MNGTGFKSFPAITDKNYTLCHALCNFFHFCVLPLYISSSGTCLLTETVVHWVCTDAGQLLHHLNDGNNLDIQHL